MDVMLWILVGLAGGLAIAALAPETGPMTRSATARRGVRDMAAGLGGAVAAGYALVLADAALRADRLTAGLGALAGALWFAGIAEAYASRRRRGEGSGLAAAVPAPGTPSARTTSAYDAAREAPRGPDTRDPLVLAGSNYGAPAPVVQEPRLAGTRLFTPQDDAGCCRHLGTVRLGRQAAARGAPGRPRDGLGQSLGTARRDGPP